MMESLGLGDNRGRLPASTAVCKPSLLASLELQRELCADEPFPFLHILIVMRITGLQF